jgi:hypothetical protein
MPRDRPPEDNIAAVSDRLELGPVDPDARRRRKRSRLIRRVLLVTALVVGVGGGVIFVQLRSKTTTVSVDESLIRFREAGSASEAVAGLPKPGVYVLATEGGDEVTVLGGSEHTYPPQTTITVTREGCGVRFRWDALGERWEEWMVCPDGKRLEVREIVTYHQFFGKSDRREYFCGEDSTYSPGVVKAGTTWSGVCSGTDGTTGTAKGELVGVEFLSVGGTRVRTLHIRVSITFSGVTDGTRESEFWFVAATGFPIVTVATDDLETDSVLGRTRYLEHYRAELTSLEPRV